MSLYLANNLGQNLYHFLVVLKVLNCNVFLLQFIEVCLQHLLYPSIAMSRF